MLLRARAACGPPLLLAAFLLSLYLVSGSSDLYHNGDTDLRYQTTQAIVDHHRLWIDHPMWMDTRVQRGRGGHLYAFYAPGQANFMIPLYVAGKAIAHHLALPYDITTLYASRSLDLVLGPILAVVFYLMALSVGYSVRTAVLLSLIFGTATAAWPDAQSALEQTQVDLFLLISVLATWWFVRTGLRRRIWLLAAGTALGLAVFTRYDAGLYIPIVGVYPSLVRVVRREPGLLRDWACYLAALLPWLALVAAWDWARFGSPFITGLHERTFGEPFWAGLLGLTVSPGKGLVWYVPLLFLLPWGTRSLYRRHAAWVLFLAAIVLFTLLFYANVLYWHGDPAWGPRYLYVALPYLILPLGEILDSWPRRSMVLRAALLLLVALSLVIQVSAVSVTQWRFWYHLEVLQQQRAVSTTWSGQPFHWGAQHYRYYWQVSRSPILIQFDDLYQVIRLDAGDQRYRLTTQPDPYVSNPVVNYPVNGLAFWWADYRHPLLGARTRAALAAALALIAMTSLALLLRTVGAAGSQPHAASRHELQAARVAGS